MRYVCVHISLFNESTYLSCLVSDVIVKLAVFDCLVVFVCSFYSVLEYCTSFMLCLAIKTD